jgi:hypothetical protein
MSMSDQTTGAQALIFEASIKRKFLGGQEDVTFEEFCTRVMQDYEAGMNVVQLMLAGEDPFPWNEDEPEFYEEFRIINRDELEAQIALAESQFQCQPRADAR